VIELVYLLTRSPEVRMEDLFVNMGTLMEQMKNHYSHVTCNDLMEKLSAQIFHLAQGVA
jgi:hypothetical protein